MDLSSKRTIKNLLKKHKIRPSKGFGQNFLVDREITKKVIEAAGLKPNDAVLEIGPGLGVLTVKLAKLAKEVMAVEKDPKMVEILKESLEWWDIRNVEIVNKDILKLIPETCNLKAKTYKVVANLPFYLTAPVIRKFLESDEPPKEMILIVQKEVGQRICSKPPEMNLLAVSVQFYAEPKIISYISKKSFWPSPEVDSAIIKISNIKNRAPSSRGGGEGEEEGKALFAFQKSKIDRNLFFKIIRAGFSQPRKQLINNLKKLNLDREKIENWLLKNKIQPTQRAETLEVGDWFNLTKTQ